METAERRVRVPTTGVFDFPTLIEGGKGMYVDKTASNFDSFLACAAAKSPTKEYGNLWMDSSLSVFYVGVNYDLEKRGIDDPLVESA
jgi:hypothetical protein